MYKQNQQTNTTGCIEISISGKESNLFVSPLRHYIKDVFKLWFFFQISLTAGNYDKFVSLITNEITSQLEKAVLKTAFNRVNSIVNMIYKAFLVLQYSTVKSVYTESV